MPISKSHHNRRRGLVISIFMIFFAAFFWIGDGYAWFQKGQGSAVSSKGRPPLRANLQFSTAWSERVVLKQGEAVELSVSMPAPSALPPQGRIGVRWTYLDEKPAPQNAAGARKPDAFGIYSAPTANWKKTLHALDPDLYLVYRAPADGAYQLEIAPIVDETPVFEGPRWRDEASAPHAVSFPRQTPWPAGKTVPLKVSMTALDLADSARAGQYVEQEPNDTPETAQSITLPEGDGIQAIRITGGSDDIEYFDNGSVGKSGDDWYRLAYTGKEPKLLTCSLSIPDHTLAAQVRLYALEGAAATATASWPPSLLPIVEYTSGRNENERVHQQNEGHRAAIVRLLQPGGVYFLRAEANAPGYELELRTLKPAPYADPQFAVRQAMYDHLGQVDAWLTNRPRGASVERRIRDTGNLMGTHCMSCHTQSGVWGTAGPIENGYRPENIQNFRRLVNVMYESLRPTNYLKDAANNTSLAPLDIGDGPAGTRVAGHNVCTAERVVAPRKLHSKQALRAANHTLQTADPSGINAAGPGSNVGQSIVYNYAGEILKRAWDQTGHPRYFAGVEEKAEKLLEVQPRYSDDMSNRIEFFKRVFPQDYLEQNKKARSIQSTLPAEPPPPVEDPAPKPGPDGKPPEPPPARFPVFKLKTAEEATALWKRIQEQLPKDEARIRAIQNPDGTWGFDPGKSSDEGKTWKTNGDWDPAPTALALTALYEMGRKPDDPAVDRGVKAMLRIQDPYGRWNKTAQTGFVTTSYAMHALSRLFPAKDPKPQRASFVPVKGESFPAALARARALAQTDDPTFLDLMTQNAANANPLIRYWGAIALGAVHHERGVPSLVKLMGDPVKMVRDAASWAMEQTLLDDQGYEAVFTAFEKGDDLTRESVLKSLGIRADAQMTQARFDQARLTRLIGRALNDDPAPGVRAWASKAAWQWWVWNQPMRGAIDQAWTKKLLSPEPNVLVENAFRYQSHALFIANGHKANGSEEHQYKELTALFKSIEAKLDDAALSAEVKDRLARRLVSIAATYYNTSGGDGGPGQMGYITPGSSDLIGKAALHLWNRTAPTNMAELKLMLEGAANVAYTPLQDKIIDYSTHGPEQLRTLAAAAVSDPSSVTLPATQEKVEPLVEQIMRGALDYDRRQTLAQPVLRLLSRAKWSVPKTTEQRDILYSLLIPKYKQDPTDAEIAQILQAAADAVKPMGQQNADWYIANQMGATLAANPDLHTDVLLKYIPGMVNNPLVGHFWLPSVSWVTSYNDDIPEVGSDGNQAHSPEVEKARAEAFKLYIQMLDPKAPVMTRSMAVRMANLTALRRNPEVQTALKKLVESDGNSEWGQAAKNALRAADPQAWKSDLEEAIRKEPLAASIKDGSGKPSLTPQFLADFRYFGDYVAPELNRPQRMDEMSCMRCHAVKGRVPSMELEGPDNNGYWNMSKMLKNYLILRERINLADLETSKLLRKPLNVQTGKEDGHQGGRRYLPSERGYQIIRRWALDQPRVTQSINTQIGSR
jgi:hypothetical protein